jgi:hypothetical protein
VFAVFAVLMVGLGAPALAQGTVTDLPDRFQLDAGGFRLAADSNLTYGLGDKRTTVDFEDELSVPSSNTTFWFDGTWRVGRKHQLKLGYTRSSREGGGVQLQRDIRWGDQVFSAGATVAGNTKADVLTGYYHFALVRKDRFEFGPALGVGYIWLSATVRATGSGSAARALERTGTTSSITGDVGVYFNGWLGKRVVARGDLLYIIVKPENSEASVTDGRLGLYWYPWHNVGLGAQYKYYKYRYDRSLLIAELGGSLRFSGAQGFVSFLF